MAVAAPLSTTFSGVKEINCNFFLLLLMPFSEFSIYLVTERNVHGSFTINVTTYFNIDQTTKWTNRFVSNLFDVQMSFMSQIK